jgi:beta-barrel assembly-enhancing protease
MSNILNISLLTITLLLSLSALGAEQSFRHRANYTDRQFDASDVVAEIKFGRSLAARILSKYTVYADQKAQEYVATLGSAVAAQVGRSELKYYFSILDSDDVNAYACPGGYIFITKGALALIKNEAQLVGVLAHEIAHVNERHVIKKLKIKGSDSSFASGLGALIGGSTASFRLALGAILDQGMALLFEQGVQKGEELDSDALAVETLMALGYDLKSYFDLIKSLPHEIKRGRAKVVSKTHPSTKQRLRSLKGLIVKNKLLSKKSLIKNEKRYKSHVSL